MNAVVAANSDWGIGFCGAQTIVIPEDRSFFRKLTDGGVIIVGRKTFKEFQNPLPNRKCLVLTRDRSFTSSRAVIAFSAGDVLEEIEGEDPDKVFVIGGAEVYRKFLPMCALAYVTKIQAAPPSDTFFPDLDTLPGWTLEKEFGMRSSECRIRYSHCVYRNNDLLHIT